MTRSEAALADLLAVVVDTLPGGQQRAGQQRMADAVAEALDGTGHLLVQAGTGTGKSLAYLVPALRSGRRVVVSTATLALQVPALRSGHSTDDRCVGVRVWAAGPPSHC